MKNLYFLIPFVFLFSFQTAAQESSLSITGFTLINADTDEDLFELKDGMQIDRDKLPTLHLDIRANTTADVESVRLSISSTGNAMNNSRTESLTPYAFFQDRPIGDYIGATFFGDFFTISAEPYSQDNLGGLTGTPLILTFEIAEYCQEATDRSDVFITNADCNGEGGRALLFTTLPVNEGDAPYWDPVRYREYERFQEPGTYEVRVGNEPGCTRTLKYTIGKDSDDCPNPEEFSLRINAGGEEIIYNDEIFTVDSYFDSGNTLVRPQTGLPEPYRSFRYSPSQQMSYAIPLADGEYTVDLHFAELWFGATDGGIGEPGKRVFDVRIEDQLAEDNLDVFAEVGAEAMLVKTHKVKITDGELNIDFSSLDVDGGERHPIINAINIASAGTTTERPFVTTRRTFGKQIELYATGGEYYNYNVDWGDGSTDVGVKANIVHTYDEDGDYQIAISGSYPRVNIFFDVDRHVGQLISVDQWGTMKWTSMEYAFSVSYPFEIRAQDVPDLSQVESMKGMFDQGSLTINDKIKDWDVGNVKDMGGMFVYTNLEHDLGNWDVSQVTDMSGMFSNAELSTENYDATLEGWSRLPSLQNDVRFDAGNSLYCLSGDARQKLIDDFGWKITDGGFSCFYDQLSVVEFVLVNADTEEDLFTISDGMKIDLKDLPTRNLDIRAETGTKTESVAFDLLGAPSISRGESIPPYALYQDLPIGDYIGHEFAIGRYFLTATPFSENNLKGEAGDALSLAFEFIDSTLTISGFALIDAATDTPLFDLVDDLYFTLDDIPSLFLDIRANTSDDVESVRLELTGQQATARTENLEPYALFRDLPIGDYIGNNFDLGSYTLTATPYSGDNLTGERGTAASVHFKILEADPVLEITGFTLIDAATDTELFDLTDGMIIPSENLPSSLLSIRANTNENVNSVFIKVSGSTNTAYFDSSEPYALAEHHGNYYGIKFVLGGVFTVTATPYIGNNQDSESGTPLSITFEIAAPVLDSRSSKSMIIAPNPVSASAVLNFARPVQLTKIQIFDVLGRPVRTYKGEKVSQGEDYVLLIDGLEPGTYFLMTHDSQGRSYRTQMVVAKP